jgi:hypothetical protein
VPVERLQALNESHTLSGEALHVGCREKGLYAHQLQTWRNAFCTSTEPTARESRGALRELQTKNDHFNGCKPLKTWEFAKPHLGQARSLI